VLAASERIKAGYRAVEAGTRRKWRISSLHEPLIVDLIYEAASQHDY
jgi:hypothetical protein